MEGDNYMIINKKGIALLSLIITMAVLVILGTVVILSLTGENNIINSTQTGLTEKEKRERLEYIETAVAASMLNVRQEIDIDKLEKKLKKNFKNVEIIQGKEIILKIDGYEYEVDENGILLPSSMRLTRFGRLLRSTSLDELASLLNILKGDISIVGPRPLPMKYAPYYYPHERIRHSVLPGLTGWAQVNGRSAVSWDKKFKMDAEYVEKMSLFMDIKILFLTVYKVIKRSDIIQDDQQTDSLHIVRAELVTKESDCK